MNSSRTSSIYVLEKSIKKIKNIAFKLFSRNIEIFPQPLFICVLYSKSINKTHFSRWKLQKVLVFQFYTKGRKKKKPFISLMNIFAIALF